MALPELKQAHTLIDRATRILLVVPERASRDALASMIATYLLLQEQYAEDIDEVSPSHLPGNMMFLPGSSQVMMEPRRTPEIALDIAGTTTVSQVRHVPLQGGVRVHVTLPPEATISRDQLELSVRPLPYDLIIVFGAADLEELGQLFTANTDFFYSTPIINVDHKPANEHFGTINIVDITAGSVAEVTHELLTSLPGSKLDVDTATALYAGIVAGTDSFQRPSTTPRSFQVAARMMELKADREAVIQHLVKTKPLDLLKLTGRLYARLRFDEHQQLYWSLVRMHDFKESGASETDLPSALHELTNNVANYTVLFVLSEAAPQQYEALLSIGRGLMQRRDEIQETLSAERENGHLRMKLTAPALETAEAQILEQVRGLLP